MSTTMSTITVILFIAAVVVFVNFVLPKMPRWMRVSFFTVLSIHSIYINNAFFSAAYAALAVSEWYN